jgi:hypothetical protein
MNDKDRTLTPRRTVSELVLAERHRGGMAVINAILEHDRAVELIQSLEPEEMHALLVDIGREDCVDLIRYATPVQFQGLLDLDAWTPDGYRPERFEAMVGLVNAAGTENLDSFFEALVDEDLVLYLRSRAQVVARTFDPDQEDEMSVEGIEAFTTPDNMFYIVLPAESPWFNDVKFIVERLYDRDHLDASALLRHAIYEDIDGLEEEAQRYRAARVATMGFPSVAETDELFRHTNPVKFRERLREKLSGLAPYDVGAVTLLPALLGADRKQPAFLADALAALGDEAVQRRVAQAVAFLANAVIVRESGGDLSRSEGRDGALRRALSLLSLGLEYLAEDAPETAPEILQRVWPKTLFRVGFSVLLPLRQAALDCLVCAGREHGFFLFDPPLGEVTQGVLQEVPVYHTSLDGEAQPVFRDFATLRDIARTRSALEQAAGLGRFVEMTLALDPVRLAERVPEALRPVTTHTTLMSTALVNALLGNDDLLLPVAADDVPRVIDLVFVPQADGSGRTFNPRFAAAVQRFLERSNDRFAGALFDLAMRKLEDFFHRYPRGIVPDKKLVAPILMVK